MDNSTIPAGQRSALTLLIEDHRAVRALFQRFGTAGEKEKQEIALQTCKELTIHAQIEEEIFYPALRGFSGELDTLVQEALNEHGEAKQLIADIQADPSTGLEDAYQSLVASVEHHVQDEETAMFPAVIQSNVTLDDVAKRLQERKVELHSK